MTSYRNNDYEFGQAILGLRNAIGLTQARLAEVLGVSRHAVVDWEAGSSYPKVPHLRALIALAAESEALTPGHEADEIRALWSLSRQKVLLDERWLAGLLAPAASPSAIISRATLTTAPARSRTDWGNALDTPDFHGRAEEIGLLTQWVLQERCRVISVLGLGGIGKSALVVNVMRRLADRFDVIIWRSLRDAPSCEQLINDCLQTIEPQALEQTPASLDQRLTLLLQSLRRRRALLVFDNLEVLLEEGDSAGHMRPEHAGYGHLLRRIAETDHQSCLLLTSREKPGDLIAFEGQQARVRTLRLTRLDHDACEQLLLDKEVGGSMADRAKLIETYAGNPLALKIVAHTIVDLFGGEIQPFIEQGDVIFGGVYELLRGQFARLSPLQQTILIWLAILREPSTLDELATVLIAPLHRSRLLEAIEALRHHSLIEHGQKRGSFTLQSVVLEFITAQLISTASEEISSGRLSRLVEHGVELAQASEYVRQTQMRLIVAPILSLLQTEYPLHKTVEGLLLARLQEMSEMSAYAQGYGPANLIALLRLERGDLRGLDLSRLLLRGVHLQGVDMQDSTLSGSTLQDSVFTETFDTVTAVALSGASDFWAAGSRHGEIRLWRYGTPVLLRAWRAHTDLVYALAFSEDGQYLASSGSWDGRVKVWNVAKNTLVWSGRHQNQAHGIAFSPDGRWLASSGNDATVLIWDMERETPTHTLTHPVRVSGIAWSPDGQRFVTGDEQGVIRVWTIEDGAAAICVQTLTGQTKMVEGLVFSSDGRALASTSWDGSVALWSMPEGALLHKLLGHSDRATRILWSKDGSTLITGSRDRTIRVWDVEQAQCRAVLQGHNAGIFGLAFLPDERSFMSGSEDGTLRQWDIESGECLRIIQGYATSVYDVDWSPDGGHLVSGGSEFRVTVWDAATGTLAQILEQTTTVVIGVGWSPDGQWLASAEWNNAIRIWNARTGEHVQLLQQQDPSASFFDRLAWSPDGRRLACSTFRRGVLVYEVGGQTPHWQENLGFWVRNVAWRPDGQRLAGAGADGSVTVFDADGVLLMRLPGHHSTIMGIGWSLDGRWIASGSRGIDGGELFIWDAQTGERRAALTAHPEIVYTLAWGPTAEMVITGGDDGTLWALNVETGERLWRREAHQGTVQSLRRSADGILASGGDDGAIRLWDALTGEPIRTLRRDRPYERLNITGIQGLTDAQKATLRDLGAVDERG